MIERAACLRSVTSSDGTVLLDIEKGTLTTLNECGAFIWQAIERGESESQIVDSLRRETNASIEMLRNDVDEFLLSLEQSELITRRQDGR